MTEWMLQPCKALDHTASEAALARQAQLTKPPGALGKMETLAVDLAARQGRALPQIKRVLVAIFAADHGIAGSGVSAFPQAVTAEMIRNFSRGGAAISVLARAAGAELQVLNLGTLSALEPLPGVKDLRLAPGTADFSTAPAMQPQQLQQALAAGRDVIHDAGALDVFIGGEMGIGNTTAATALSCALTGIDAASLCGRGTGIDDATLAHKSALIDAALSFHRAHERPLTALMQCLGGFEIAGLAGAYLACAQRGIPILLDGFICTAAALWAERLKPGVSQWMIASHCSQEPGHRVVLEVLGLDPLLNLEMRLGEGSGAAVALPLLKSACELHAGMATFAEAGISQE